MRIPRRGNPPASKIRRISVAGLTAAALFTGLATTAAPAVATTTPSAATLYSWSVQLFAELNNDRYINHIPVVHMNTFLLRSSLAHDNYMSRYNTMSHRLPGEPDLGPRIAATGYTPWCALGENIGWNSDMSFSGAEWLQNYMYNEKAPNDGHRQVMLSRAYYDVGITITYDTAHHKIWLTEDFGRRC